jgi:NADPH:quinone reductase-like Zn-dependent oxidoreductase
VTLCAVLLQVGQAVFGLAEGCLGSAVVAQAGALAALPALVSWEEAASLPTVFITATSALLSAAGAAAGEVLLLPAASGGVGVAALQVCLTSLSHPPL